MVVFGKKFLIPLIILLVLVVGTLLFLNQEKIKRMIFKETPSQEIVEKVINYINQNMLPEGKVALLLGVREEDGLYKIRIKIDENEYTSYLTKDGKLFFPQVIDLTAQVRKEPPQKKEKEIGKEIVKREIPDVKLFVMSYCPFGLQAEKMYLPVYNLLKNKMNAGVYFVDYIMHGKKELDENLRQYCIQKVEAEKYYDYLNCFVKEGDWEKCLNVANVDATNLSSCISETDKEYNITLKYNDKNTWLNGRYPQFPIHTHLNENYGVRGSPTVVINDKVVNVNPRSPENFKNIVCQSFQSPPNECSQTLSNEVPSTGFGLGRGSSSSGGCQ